MQGRFLEMAAVESLIQSSKIVRQFFSSKCSVVDIPSTIYYIQNRHCIVRCKFSVK